jgi:hypothetical protein
MILSYLSTLTQEALHISSKHEKIWLYNMISIDYFITKEQTMHE